MKKHSGIGESVDFFFRLDYTFHVFRKITFTLLFVLLAGCGAEVSEFSINVPTNAPPTVTRINPANASAGTTVTIFGFGFSIVAAENIITVGSSQISASAYALLDPPAQGEVESLTFTVPAEANVGTQTIFVVVGEHISNTDVNVTVDP